jgi:hypothetical protein
MKKFEMSKLLKWIPVAIAGVVAVYQAVGEQKEAERIDDMEERIARLETGDDEDIEEMEEA